MTAAARLLLVPCSWCLAAPGERCRTKGGRVLAKPHAARRERPPVEDDAYARFVVRIVRAFGRRAARNVETIARLAEVQAQVHADLERELGTAVAGCRAEGWAWQDIADVLGVTRQAVQQRFGQTAGAE